MMLTLHDPQKTREHYASGAWQHDTMFGLLAKHTAQRPSAVALRDNFTTLTGWRPCCNLATQPSRKCHDSAGLFA